MPPTQHLLPEDVLVDHDHSADRELVDHVLDALPAHEYRRLLADFIVVARRCDITRDYSPLRRLSDSVFVTARLQCSDEYRTAVEKALTAPPGPPVDGGEFLAMLRAKRQ